MNLPSLSIVQADRLDFKMFLRRIDLLCVLLSVVLEACDAEILPFFQCFSLRLNIPSGELDGWSEIEQLQIGFLQESSQRSRFFWRTTGAELASPRGLRSLSSCTTL